MEHGVDWTGQDLAGWYLSEKLHGCRAYWDGQELWSRGGMKVKLPPSWRSALPVGVQLDGEVYDGHDGVYRCGAALRYGRLADSMQFIVFDAPTLKGSWPERLRGAASSLPESAVVRCVEYRVCMGLDDAIQELQQVRGRGGEGFMLRAPDHRYTAGRSRSLVKFTRSSVMRE